MTLLLQERHAAGNVISQRHRLHYLDIGYLHPNEVSIKEFVTVGDPLLDYVHLLRHFIYLCCCRDKSHRTGPSSMFWTDRLTK